MQVQSHHSQQVQSHPSQSQQVQSSLQSRPSQPLQSHQSPPLQSHQSQQPQQSQQSQQSHQSQQSQQSHQSQQSQAHSNRTPESLPTSNNLQSLEISIQKLCKELEGNDGQRILGLYRRKQLAEKECIHQEKELKAILKDQQDQLSKLKFELKQPQSFQNHRKEIERLNSDISTKRESLNRNLSEKEKLEEEIEEMKRTTLRLKELNRKEGQRHQESVPEAQKMHKFYAQIMPIVWQKDDKYNVEGFFHFGNGVEPFSFDQRSYSKFEIANSLWNIQKQILVS